MFQYSLAPERDPVRRPPGLRRAVKVQRRVLHSSVAVHLLQPQLVAVHQALRLHHRLLPGEHAADLHEGLVLGLGDDHVHVDGHRQTDAGEHQVAVGPCRHLMGGERREQAA